MISDSLSNTTTNTLTNNNNNLISIYCNRFIKNMNLSGNDCNSTAKATAQACAACKHQRKKCVPDCILAPYFPHDRQRQFLNAHKLFGVSNITKIIKNLCPIEKDEAMRTIIFQSDVRATDPVGGCYGVINDLQTQIEYSRAELDLVLQQLAVFRAHQQQQQHNQPHTNQAYVTAHPTNDVNAAALRNGSEADDHDHMILADLLSLCNNSGGVHCHYFHQQPHQQQQYGTVQMNNNSGSNCSTTHMDDPSSWGGQNATSTLSTLSLHGHNAVGDEYESRTLLVGMPSSANHYRFDIPEEFERSDEAVSFEVDDEVLIKAGEYPFHQVQDHDLKDAAHHLFTLTNCNS